jgi:hypothetical protein
MGCNFAAASIAIRGSTTASPPECQQKIVHYSARNHDNKQTLNRHQRCRTSRCAVAISSSAINGEQVGPTNTNYPDLNDLSELQLAKLRQFIEENDDLEVGEELAALIADEWPWLLEKVRRPKPH